MKHVPTSTACALVAVIVLFLLLLSRNRNRAPQPGPEPVYGADRLSAGQIRDALSAEPPSTQNPEHLAAIAGNGHNATGTPEFEAARVVRDADLSALNWGETQRYGFDRLIQFRNTPPGFTYSRKKECPECDPHWDIPTVSTASQRGLSAMENMATAELDTEQLYNFQQGRRNLAQLAIHASYK